MSESCRFIGNLCNSWQLRKLCDQLLSFQSFFTKRVSSYSRTSIQNTVELKFLYQIFQFQSISKSSSRICTIYVMNGRLKLLCLQACLWLSKLCSKVLLTPDSNWVLVHFWALWTSRTWLKNGLLSCLFYRNNNNNKWCLKWLQAKARSLKSVNILILSKMTIDHP